MNCVASFGGGTRFAQIVPLYIYSAKTAYPNAAVKVFWHGVLPKNVADMLSEIREFTGLDQNWNVKERCFEEIPARASTCNSLRLLLPQKDFKEYRNIYITDLDMIIVAQKISHWEYYRDAMESCRSCFAAVGGAKLKPKRPEINGGSWDSDFTRINNTMFMIRNPEWFDKTKAAREFYYKCLRNSRPDGIDTHVPMSYREYDEVMHYRILKASGLAVPMKKFRFSDDRAFDMRYRDIHLGDFIHENRYNKFGKMSALIKKSTLRSYLKLKKTMYWQLIEDFSNRDTILRTMLRRLDKHCKKRL